MAGIYNFKLDQGSDKDITLTFYTDTTKTETIDLSGYHWKMQLRKQKDDISYIDELSDTNSRIDITDAATGIIILKFPNASSSKYDFEKCYYDLESINGTSINREIEGQITLNKEVTR